MIFLPQANNLPDVVAAGNSSRSGGGGRGEFCSKLWLNLSNILNTFGKTVIYFFMPASLLCGKISMLQNGLKC